MTTLFDSRAILSRATSGKKAQPHKFQADAIKALERLGDNPVYLPQYLAIFKRAGGLVDLSDLVEAAKNKADTNPGAYFLQSARVRLGMNKK